MKGGARGPVGSTTLPPYHPEGLAVRKLSMLLSLALIATSPVAAQVAQAKPKPHHSHHHHGHKAVKHGYVFDHIDVPTSSTQARDMGLDLNGDGTTDNRLGQFFAVLAGQGFDIQGTVDDAVRSGAFVTLLSVQTRSLKKAKGVKLRLFRGMPVVNPVFGGGSFGVDTSVPRSQLKAKIKAHVLVPDPGPMTIGIPSFAATRPAVTYDLREGRILATCGSTSCVGGRIVGGIPTEEIDQRFVPELGAALRAIVTRDCPTTPPDACPPGTTGETALNVFDSNHDGVISDQEIRDSPLIKSLLAPDLDLVGGDGVADSLSVGLGFTAASADIAGD
jgi:hypothetical protein